VQLAPDGVAVFGRRAMEVLVAAAAAQRLHVGHLAWISQTRTYQGGEPGRHLHFSGTQDLVCW
jgi:hypothetical protein